MTTAVISIGAAMQTTTAAHNNNNDHNNNKNGISPVDNRKRQPPTYRQLAKSPPIKDAANITASKPPHLGVNIQAAAASVSTIVDRDPSEGTAQRPPQVTSPGLKQPTAAAGIGIAMDAAAAGDVTRSTTASAACVGGNLKLAYTIEGPSHAMSVRFSRDANYIAAGFAEGTVKMYDVQSGQCVSTLADDVTTTSGQPVTCLRFGVSDGLMLTTYASGIVKLWRPQSTTSSLASSKFTSTWSSDEARHTLAAAFNPAGNRFVTTGSTPEIHLYDVETGKRLITMEAREHRAIMDGHRARVFAVQFHAKQQNIFLTGGWDDTVQYWDDRQPHAVRKFFGPHICGDALDIDADRDQILTGSWRKDSTLQIWDFASGSKIRDVPSDRILGNSSLYCAQWLGTDQIFCGGSEHHVARTINRSAVTTCGHVTGLTSGVYSADNSSRVEAINSGSGGRAASSRLTLALASGSTIYVIRYSQMASASSSAATSAAASAVSSASA